MTVLIATVGQDTGASKWNEAKKRGTKLMVEGSLLDMVRASVPFVEDDAANEAIEDVQIAGGIGNSPTGGTVAGIANVTSKSKVQVSSAKRTAAAAPSAMKSADAGESLILLNMKQEKQGCSMEFVATLNLFDLLVDAGTVCTNPEFVLC